MSLILRIDVDRPYGKKNIIKHILSRLASDFYFPKINSFGYLHDLRDILQILNNKNIHAYIFFRKCTLPTRPILKLIYEGKHIPGLHLENSKNYHTFRNELKIIEQKLKQKITVFSKHGSGKNKYGINHYPPYEPEKYIEWGIRVGIKYFFGNYENPELKNYLVNGLSVFPAAYWLEPYWRNYEKFNFEWLHKAAKTNNIVLLLHPDNITVDLNLYHEFLKIIEQIPFGILD